ncbi:MAG: TVP38/TMEM64 family protein [Gammaproteobacteria bacterium]
MKNILLLLMITLTVGLFLFPDGMCWLSFDLFKRYQETLLLYTQRHYWQMFAVSGMVFMLATIFCLPVGMVLSLAVGFLFGRWMGTLLMVIAATFGATAIFWLARYLFSDWAKAQLENCDRGYMLLQGFQRNACSYLLFLRLVPVFPFWLVNLAPAFTSVSSRVYILTTFIGIMPGSFVFANLGSSLGGVERPAQLLTAETMWTLSLLGVLSLIPVLIKQRKS